MQLRRFTADSTPAALGAVRLALGDDAIILANRKIGDQVEIIATGQMDDAQSLAEISLESVAQNTPPQKNSGNSEGGVNLHHKDRQPVGVRPSLTEASTTIEDLTAVIEAAEKSVKPSPITQFNTAPSNASLVGDSDISRNESRMMDFNVQSDAKKYAATPETLETRRTENTTQETPVASSNNHLLQGEVQALSIGLDSAMVRQTEKLTQIIEAQSAMINQYFKGMEVNLWGNSSPNRTLHLQRLFALGIGAELAIQLVERSNPEHSVEDALRHSFALLKSTLPIGVDKTFRVPGITILSGPPGAGKTTVLMKIATQHVKEHGNDSIVIICADTRRIGAFEELQAYGRLLGVPTVHAHDSSELESLLSAFTHKQLVLVDHTLPLDNDVVELPHALLNPKVADSVRQLLVLSATSQSATIDALITQHCVGRSMQCVLTNLDANARLGEMLNAIIRHHIPIAYWSDTASIQQPLQKAEASVLIATAVAMSRRLRQTPDEEWLLRLIQPSDNLMTPAIYKKTNPEVIA